MLSPNKHQADALPGKEDVVHFVISLQEIGQIDQLGQSLEQRITTFKNAIRQYAQEHVAGTWIAGIHLNTGIPHAHVTINRQH